MIKPQLAHCSGWGINPRALLSLWGFSPWKWWKSRLQEKYRLSWALSTHLLGSVQCLILFHHAPQFLPAMPSPQQCKGRPSHLEQPAFILNLMQQSVFLCSPPSSEGTCVSLGIHPTTHPGQVPVILPSLFGKHLLSISTWKHSVSYIIIFFINSLCWLAWQNIESCVCPKAQWKLDNPSWTFILLWTVQWRHTST